MDLELRFGHVQEIGEAFEQIVLAKGEPLFRTALAIVGNEADARDATQETFVSAWRGLAFLKDFDRFDAWMGRIRSTPAARFCGRAADCTRFRWTGAPTLTHQPPTHPLAGRPTLTLPSTD